MIRIVLSLVTLVTWCASYSSKLPFHSWEPRFKTNPDKYRAILLDINFEDDPLDTWEARRSYQSHFLMRTSSTPIGPGLNSGSFVGIVDQQMPLVGYDLIQASAPRGYWPLFSTTKATLYVDQSTARWINVYSAEGPADSVMCDDGEVIIGVRYSSHKNAAQFAPNDRVAEIPDIQCARLQETAQVMAVDIDSVNTRNVTVDSSGGGTIKTTQSVMDVKQCMLDKTNNFHVQDKGATMNTCYGNGKGTVTSGNVLLFEYLMSLRVDEDYRKRNPENPMLIDFMIRQEKPVTAEDLFGTDDDKTDAQIKAGIQASKDTAINKAQAEYQANWGTTVDVQATIQELGDKPWSSDKLIAGSAEFVSGSLTSGSPMQIIRGFARSDDPSFPVAMICGSVIGCAHGSCKNNKCVCNAGFSGGACTDRLDPCGNNPCGTKGRCTENFSANNTMADGSPKQYTCACDTGFLGDNCDKSTDPCLVAKDGGFWSSVDCGQGSCVAPTPSLTNVTAPVATNYTCSCFPGYSLDSAGACSVRSVDCVGVWSPLALCDANCLQKEVFKINVPAEGSGTNCTNIEGDSRTTICTGGNCKKCMSRTCNGRGKCDDAKGQCVCTSGWTGSNCEQANDICSSSFCNGRGNCNEQQTSCTCVNGWKSQPGATAKFCDVDPCSGCPPGNCNTDTGTCACPDELPAGQWPACSSSSDCAGYWGPWGSCSATCDQKRYYTIATPATNGGQMCSQKAGDFQSQRCSSGMCCTLKAADCQNGSDYDSATCMCRCRPGFQGDKCEYKSATADKIVQTERYVDAATMALFNTTARPDVGFEQGTMAAEATTAPPANTKMYIYIGAGVGALLLIGGAAWFFLGKKKPPVTDPLLAGMEGMEGLDLTGMDLSALGVDPNAPNVNPL